MNEIDALSHRLARLEAMYPRLHSRYPYTYACDYIRQHFGVHSRSDASHKMIQIAELFGDSDHQEKVAIAFAEAFLAESKR